MYVGTMVLCDVKLYLFIFPRFAFAIFCIVCLAILLPKLLILRWINPISHNRLHSSGSGECFSEFSLEAWLTVATVSCWRWKIGKFGYGGPTDCLNICAGCVGRP